MSSAPNLPKTRQATRNAQVALMSDGHTAQETLTTRAFLMFTQAAGSLEKSYTQLQSEVGRLRVELQRANSELERSLEKNARMRGCLTRVLENLPCGVLVAGRDGVQIINPEARRLLEVAGDWTPGVNRGLPPTFAALVSDVPTDSFFASGNSYCRGVRAIAISASCARTSAKTPIGRVKRSGSSAM